MAGAEDARLEALRSLRAAYTISAPEPKQHAKLLPSVRGQGEQTYWTLHLGEPQYKF